MKLQLPHFVNHQYLRFSRYGGHKLSDEQRKIIVRRLEGAGNEGLQFFGYKLDDWGIARSAPA